MSDKKADELEIYLNGNINSGNAEQVELSIQDMIMENPHKKICLDLSDLSFISEKGLEALKNIADKSSNIELRNVTDDLYEVLKKSGLTTIIPVHKKFKIETD